MGYPQVTMGFNTILDDLEDHDLGNLHISILSKSMVTSLSHYITVSNGEIPWNPTHHGIQITT